MKTNPAVGIASASNICADKQTTDTYAQGQFVRATENNRYTHDVSRPVPLLEAGVYMLVAHTARSGPDPQNSSYDDGAATTLATRTQRTRYSVWPASATTGAAFRLPGWGFLALQLRMKALVLVSLAGNHQGSAWAAATEMGLLDDAHSAAAALNASGWTASAAVTALTASNSGRN
ncbi:hypothetical protein ON010_g9546 [Phytophthora cinnamomi]|nr:hypothetical protein ON010_g9546 [Phytophthora cinnamomi]